MMFSDIRNIHIDFSWGLVQSCRSGNNKHPYSAILHTVYLFRNQSHCFQEGLLPRKCTQAGIHSVLVALLFISHTSILNHIVLDKAL